MTLPTQSSLPSSVPVQKYPAPNKAAVLKTDDKTVDAKKPDADKKAKGDEFTFFDFLDIINPLQHIPIVNNIYREITGDKINNSARIIGGAIFGGPVGAVMGGINAIAVNETGKDLGQMAMNKVGLTKDDDVVVAHAKKDAKNSDKDYPIVEVRPLAKNAKAAPMNNVWQLSDIIWDDAKPPKIAGLPSAKELNDLEPVSGLNDEAVALNAIEPGIVTDAPIAPVAEKQIPNQMMQALDKYKELKSSPLDAGAIVADNNVEKKQDNLILPKIADANNGVQPSPNQQPEKKSRAPHEAYAGLGKIRRY